MSFGNGTEHQSTFREENIMTKNDNAHSVRMVESIKQMDSSFATDFENRHRLSKSAKIGKKFEWADDVCHFLEEHFTEDTIIEIRKSCRCNDGRSIANKMAKYLNKSNSIRKFVDLFNQNESFACLEYISENSILFCYPQCYCACVKRISKELSKTWCYCTLGNAEGIFEKLFMKEVNVNLLGSIKTGSHRCVISVEW